MAPTQDGSHLHREAPLRRAGPPTDDRPVGLVPSWAKDIKIGSKLINARSEKILEEPPFRKAAAARRALIPAKG